MDEFLNDSEKILKQKLLPDITIIGNTIQFMGSSLKLNISIKRDKQEELKDLLLSMFIRGLTVKNLRSLEDDIPVFQRSAIKSVFDGITVNDGTFIDTTIVSDHFLEKIFNIKSVEGSMKMEGDQTKLIQELSQFLNGAIRNYNQKNLHKSA